MMVKNLTRNSITSTIKRNPRGCSFALLSLALCLGICLIHVVQIQADTTQSDVKPTVPETPEPSIEETSEKPGLFGRLFSPIRKAIRGARNLLGTAAGEVHQGIDRARLETYKMFMKLYNKSYSPEELPRRMALFFQRRAEIEQSVQAYREGKTSFVMKENEFTDWDDNELKRLTGVKLPDQAEMTSEELAPISNENEGSIPAAVSRVRDLLGETADEEENRSNGRSYWMNDIEEKEDPEKSFDEAGLVVQAPDSIPASKDWRESGCVAKPMNQRQCGACYAIATIGVLETMRCLQSDTSPTLSSQQVVDCATPRTGYDLRGCDGGWPTKVLDYLQNVGSISRDSCYPFAWRQQTCRLRTMKQKDGCTVSSSPSNSRLRYKVLHDERDILYHVGKTGPVVTVMKATNKFLYYNRGIFDDSSCSRRRNDVDHAISIVGYGTENGQDYWIIKNSWGTTTWGENGFGRYKRGSNACSIGHWGWVITS